VYFFHMPGSWLLQRELDELVREIRRAWANPEAMRSLLVGAIRTASTRHPNLIGPHCMSVLLRPPRCDITFLPSTQRPNDELRSPWLVVGDDLLVSHAVMQGPQSAFGVKRGGFEIMVTSQVLS
jgi:hypothetical protein